MTEPVPCTRPFCEQPVADGPDGDYRSATYCSLRCEAATKRLLAESMEADRR